MHQYLTFIVSNHNSQLSILNSHFSFNSQLQLSTLNFQLSPPFPYSMRLFHTFILLLLSLTAAHAQQFGTEWMTSPSSTDSSCVWFRRTFVAHNPPKHASVCVATDSRFILYVNGRNVSTALYMPSHVDTDLPTVSFTFDVTRFLRTDTNTVALFVAPTATLKAPQLSISFYGIDSYNQSFATCNIDGWTYCAASTRLTTDGELTDKSLHSASFPFYRDIITPMWQPVTATETSRHSVNKDYGTTAESIYGYNHLLYNVLNDDAIRVRQILSPRFFDRTDRSITYDFSPGFYGFVRVTLRGCQRGEHIYINGMEYICSGEMDEQAYCRFTARYMRRITITGDRHFNPEQVQEVEAVCQ